MHYPSLLLTGLWILLQTVSGWSQGSAGMVLRAFPITDYQVPLNDSLLLVQVELPPDQFFRDRQAGVLVGVYHSAHRDTVRRGSGRCQLIKPPYYYFAMRMESGVPAPQKGDLLYTLMDSTSIYQGLISGLAGHFIELQNVYEQSFYDRYGVFRSWTAASEDRLLDSLVADIRFTGNYFLENDPSADRKIEKGPYTGQPVLTLMKNCRKLQLQDFLGYILARPRLYAGQTWKIAEIFATWLFEGAPAVQAGPRY